MLAHLQDRTPSFIWFDWDWMLRFFVFDINGTFVMVIMFFNVWCFFYHLCPCWHFNSKYIQASAAAAVPALLIVHMNSHSLVALQHTQQPHAWLLISLQRAAPALRRKRYVDYLVGYEWGDPVFPSVGVDEDVFLPPQCSGSGPGCDGLLEGLIQKLGSWGHTDRLDGRLSSFTVDLYLEWTRLGEEFNWDTQSTSHTNKIKPGYVQHF